MADHQRHGAVDIQTHYVAPAAARILARYRDEGGTVDGIGAIGPDDPMCGLDARLRAMDEAGITISVLSFAPIGAIADAATAVALCRAANDGLIAACARHPDRFVAAAMLPLPDADAAVAELARLADAGSIRAVQILAQTTDYTPDAAHFLPLWRKAAEQRLPLLIHPTSGVADLAPQFDAYGLSSGMHAMVSHALVAARLIQSGVLDDVPDLELILTHLGGILPVLIDRLDSRAQGPAMHKPSHYLRARVHADMCGYPAGPALRCAIETFGADRLLIGSDWPSRPIAPALEALRDLGLGEEDEAAIRYGNALRWFDPAKPRR